MWGEKRRHRPIVAESEEQDGDGVGAGGGGEKETVGRSRRSSAFLATDNGAGDGASFIGQLGDDALTPSRDDRRSGDAGQIRSMSLSIDPPSTSDSPPSPSPSSSSLRICAGDSTCEIGDSCTIFRVCCMELLARRLIVGGGGPEGLRGGGEADDRLYDKNVPFLPRERLLLETGGVFCRG